MPLKTVTPVWPLKIQMDNHFDTELIYYALNLAVKVSKKETLYEDDFLDENSMLLLNSFIDDLERYV